MALEDVLDGTMRVIKEFNLKTRVAYMFNGVLVAMMLLHTFQFWEHWNHFKLDYVTDQHLLNSPNCMDPSIRVKIASYSLQCDIAEEKTKIYPIARAAAEIIKQYAIVDFKNNIALLGRIGLFFIGLWFISTCLSVNHFRNKYKEQKLSLGDNAKFEKHL